MLAPRSDVSPDSLDHRLCHRESVYIHCPELLKLPDNVNSLAVAFIAAAASVIWYWILPRLTMGEKKKFKTKTKTPTAVLISPVFRYKKEQETANNSCRLCRVRRTEHPTDVEKSLSTNRHQSCTKGKPRQFYTPDEIFWFCHLVSS